MQRVLFLLPLMVLAGILWQAPQARGSTAENMVLAASPQGTGFTVQGQLQQSGAPINGTCDLQFGLWDALSGGTQIGITQSATGVTLTNGLFNVTVNFGAAFDGNARWLEIATRCPTGVGSFTTLGPRQPVNPTPYALSTAGDQTVHGNLTATGNLVIFGSKSAAVPYPDGSHRLMFALEAPDNWFEDFGKAQLVNGHATVPIPADFVATVRTDDYYVFLTPYGDSSGLYVSNQTPSSFEVREQRGGTDSLPFSYRIVAKRRDVSPQRLPAVSPPTGLAPSAR